jgi:hypothetical protein
LKAETFLPKTGRALKHSFACGMKKMSITWLFNSRHFYKYNYLLNSRDSWKKRCHQDPVPAATTSTQSVPIAMRRRESEWKKNGFFSSCFFGSRSHVNGIKTRRDKNKAWKEHSEQTERKKNKKQAMREKVAASEKCEFG